MTIARENLVNPLQLEHHHVTSRCTRQGFMMGTDELTGKNYDHRKEWIRDRLKLLVENFTIEVGGYALMDNHFHLETRNRSDLNLKLTDREVIDRWINIYRPRLSTSKKVSEDVKMENHKLKILEDSDRMAELRIRLSNLSWFMKALKEYIARKANKEDGGKGHFWEARFSSQLITSQEGVMLCQAYIDLNPIRASIEETPEASTNTSAYDRIEAMQSKEKIKLARKLKDEQGELTIEQKQKINESFQKRNNYKWLAPFNQGPDHEKCFYMNVTQKE